MASLQNNASSPPTSYPVVVIGAGQAGLAMSYYLHQHGIAHLVLDRHERIGDTWRNRWQSLHLFTPARYSRLPGLAFPAPAYSLPSRLQMADYLEQYATQFGLPVQTGISVTELTGEFGHFKLLTSAGILPAAQVVIATGSYPRPFTPAFSHQVPRTIWQLHTAHYFSPQDVPPGPVLVVGAGASGIQIALELAATHEVVLAGCDPGNLPRTMLGKDIYWWLYKLGIFQLPADSWLAHWLHRGKTCPGSIRVGDHLPNIVTTHGIARRGALEGITHSTFSFSEGDAVTHIKTIIWATGYQPAYEWIKRDILHKDGTPRHHKGIVPAAPGLYFIGLPDLASLDSGLINGVGRDAKRLAKVIRNLI